MGSQTMNDQSWLREFRENLNFRIKFMCYGCDDIDL